MARNGEWFEKLSINTEIRKRDATNLSLYSELDKFTETMSSELDRKKWYDPVAFTPHDFSHHVKTVLQYGSELLTDSLAQFTIDDLLVFQYACILHDIDMVYNPYGREKHSVSGSQILDNFSNERIKTTVDEILSSVSNDIQDMSDSEDAAAADREELIAKVHNTLHTIINFLIPNGKYQEAIGMIILGHSDIKLDNRRNNFSPKEFRIDTLRKEFYQNEIRGSENREKIKTRVLAAILRLADELDCSKQRKFDIDDTLMPIESQKYWERLELINDVVIELPNISLIINSSYIANHNDRNHCFELLRGVHEKIEKERKTVTDCFKDERFPLMIGEVKLQFNNPKIEKEYNQYYEELQYQKKKFENAGTFEVEGLKDYIKKRIEEKGLFCEDHRNISGKGMRNYLDCNGLLTDPNVLDGVSRAFMNNIYTKSFDQIPNEMFHDEYILVGVANSGVLLASRIAMATGLPMLYYVPPRKKEIFSEQEMDWSNYSQKYKGRKAILIIGVNLTGESIHEANDFLQKIFGKGEKNYKIEAVMGIVNRDKNNSVLKKMEDCGIRISFLLEEYPIDWCNYNEATCPYKMRCKKGY